MKKNYRYYKTIICKLYSKTFTSVECSMCPGSSDPFYIVTYYI